MKRIFDKMLVILLVLVTAATLTACGEKELSGDEAYAEVGAAIENALKDVTELSVVLSGTAEITKTETSESERNTETEADETGTYTASADLRIKISDDGVVNAAAVKVELTDNKDQPLKLELYIKDGYTYAYTNLFGDSYTYDESDGEPINKEDIDEEEVKKAIADLKERLPAPKATKKGEETTIVWTVNNDNAKDYIKAFSAVFGEEMGDDEIEETLSEINVEKGELTLTLEGGRIKKIAISAKASGKGMNLNASLTASVAYSGVVITYDEARLSEIRNNASAA